jgi:hypothetical protein
VARRRLLAATDCIVVSEPSRHDRTVGFANGVFQTEEIPNSVLHFVADEGDWLLHKRFDAILGRLI